MKENLPTIRLEIAMFTCDSLIFHSFGTLAEELSKVRSILAKEAKSAVEYAVKSR